MTRSPVTTVLAISSQVVRGHVGNSASAFALQMQGYDVWPLPTIVLSNHPGHGATSGQRTTPETMAAMIASLGGHGWMEEIDAVLTGYIADAGQAAVIAEAVAALKTRRPEVLYCCDPVIGDYGKGLYVAPEIAAAIRDGLAPLADIITPNRFELGYLTGNELESADLEDVTAAAHTLDARNVLVTSAGITGAGGIQNLYATQGGDYVAQAPYRDGVPNGTGDLMAALVLASRLEGAPDHTAVDTCTRIVAAVIDRSLEAGADELALVGCRDVLPVGGQPTG